MVKLNLTGCGLMLAALTLAPALSRGAEKPQDVKLVKYAELGELVKKNRGKVVVVDFWNIH